MKVAYLLGSLNRGGTETMLLDVLRNAKLEQLSVIAIYRKPGELETSFRESGVPLFFLAYNGNPIIFALQLRKLLRQQKIAIVHAHQFIDAFAAWIASLGTDIRLVQTIHGYDHSFERLMKYMVKFTLVCTTKNIFVSKNQQDYYTHKYNLKPENQVVVYNGIAVDKFDHFQYKPIRNELGLNPSTVLLGSVGNFNEGRDQLTLCRFANLLKAESVNFHMVLIGKRVENEMDRFDRCVAYCQENSLLPYVTFLGTRDDVINILNQLDVFIYATDHDTFGIAVVEAMAAGVPVFVNDWKVMIEITENGKLASLYETRNINDLKIKFEAFLANKTLFKKIAAQNALWIRDRYNIFNHIQKLMNVYKNLFGN